MIFYIDKTDGLVHVRNRPKLTTLERRFGRASCKNGLANADLDVVEHLRIAEIGILAGRVTPPFSGAADALLAVERFIEREHKTQAVTDKEFQAGLKALAKGRKKRTT